MRDRLLALADEHSPVVDGIEYVEWSRVLSVLEEEVSRGTREPGGPEPSPGHEAAS